MILQSLAAYYDRLLAEGAVQSPGFQAKDIRWVIELEDDGRFVALRRTGDDKRARSFVVPTEIKRSVNIAANLLWDNPEYGLGVVRANSDDKQAAKVPLRHAAFRERLRTLPADDVGLSAVMAFLERRDFAALESADGFAEMAAGGANLSFRLAGDTTLVCERPAVREAIVAGGGGGTDGPCCLVTGRTGPTTRLHPNIKGVPGGQPSGTSLVSFNHTAFTSHGWSQGDNAPVSEAAAHAYGAALNHLLERGNDSHRFREGDTTYVFWAQGPSLLEGRLGPAVTGWGASYESDGSEVKDTFQSVRDGLKPALDDPTPFYVLGLAANAARLAVTFWHAGTVQEMAATILRHFDDVAIAGLADDGPPPGLWRLLGAVAPEGDPKRLQDQLRGRLSAGLMTAMLGGTRYPATLLARAVERCRRENTAPPMRAALIKAILNRSTGRNTAVSLDTSNTNPGYLLGRLFAVREAVQRASQGKEKSNVTIRDRFFGAAMTSPMAVHPQLERLMTAHKRKFKNGYPKRFSEPEKQIYEGLTARDGIPSHFSLDEQGMFILGYHHQRNAIWDDKAESSVDSSTDEGQE